MDFEPKVYTLKSFNVEDISISFDGRRDDMSIKPLPENMPIIVDVPKRKATGAISAVRALLVLEEMYMQIREQKSMPT